MGFETAVRSQIPTNNNATDRVRPFVRNPAPERRPRVKGKIRKGMDVRKGIAWEHEWRNEEVCGTVSGAYLLVSLGLGKGEALGAQWECHGGRIEKKRASGLIHSPKARIFQEQYPVCGHVGRNFDQVIGRTSCMSAG